ncbi:hypothetical protein [Streptomyces sp. NBC_01439]|uniref:hypothetical protein n=1 Tax=Streptomyces sp. NBC_01439 TaxID=2903867 RepID=UPI002E28C25A|nr:hypothetical protein [Streptomyces sp. NBC_01439]
MTYPPQPEPFSEALGEAAHTAVMAYRLVLTISAAVRRAAQKRLTGREEELGEDAGKMAPGWSADQLRGHLGDDVMAVLMRDTDWPQMARHLVGTLQNVADQRHFGWDQLLLGRGGYVSAPCDPSSMIDEYEKLLAGLDDVDWAGLSHAYRSAHDVPGHIRALCGSDDEARKEAFSRLFSSIFHQGSRYSASPFAVPFLARIAVGGPAAARENAMWLLTRLAVDWHDEYDVTTGINVAGWRAAAAEVGPEVSLPWYEEQLAAEPDPDKRAELQEMRDWVAAGNSPDSRWSALQSYDAVLAELPSLLVLLDDADACLRTRIAYLLAWFPEFSATSLPRLLALATHERDPVTAATALLAAGLLGPFSTAEDITPYLDAADPLMRWAAATALIRLAALDGAPVGPSLLSRAVTELTAAARNPFDRVTDYCGGDLHGHIERTLHSLPAGSDPASVREALDACLPRIVWDYYGSRTRRAIEALFLAPQPHPTPRYADLTAAQQQLLGDLAGQRHPWLIRSSADRLRDLGLPHTQEALQHFVGAHRTA